MGNIIISLLGRLARYKVQAMFLEEVRHIKKENKCQAEYSKTAN